MGTISRQKAAVDLMRTSPAEFRRHLLVDVNGRTCRLADVLKPWQKRDYEALDEGWRRAIGLPPNSNATYRSRAMLLRGRGCSKTSDLAVSALWALWAAHGPVQGIAAAGSKDQAALIVRAIRRLLKLNPWIASTIEVQRFAVINKQTDAELTVIAADAGLAMGHLVDFILADEIVHWDAGGEDLWHTLFSTAAKKENCLLAVLSNSGHLDSWQHKVCESLRESPDCHYSQTDETETLLSPRQLEEQRRVLPPLVFDRLFRNIWVPSQASGLDEESLRRCVGNYQYPMKPDTLTARGWTFLGGADLSATRDHAAISIVAVHGTTGKIRVAWSKRFAPKNGAVDLIEVVNTLKSVHKSYCPLSWRMDSFESRRLQQELRREGIIVTIESFQGNNAAEMASALLAAVNSNQLEIPEDDPGLLQDFRGIAIVEKNGIMRVVADRSARGHCDQAFSIIVTLRAAQELSVRGCSPGDSISAGYRPVDFARRGVPIYTARGRGHIAFGRN